MGKIVGDSDDLDVRAAADTPRSARRSPPSLGWLALGVAPLAMAAAGAGLRARMRRALPLLEGTLTGPVQAPVQVVRDRWGIPHIQAASADDLFVAQGMVHAQDRLWQIDFQRHLAQGRLSELFGPITLQADRLLRRFAVRPAAEAEVAALDDEERAAMEGYCRGVNAVMAEAIATRHLPIEFALVRHEPQPYTVTDAICWSKMMAFGLGGNWEDELVRARLVARLGPEKAARLEPMYHEGHPLALEPGADYQGLDAALAGVLAEYERLLDVTGLEILARGAIPASNNWVVAPARSATGQAILCDDPHLPLQAPAVWYLNHLTGGGYDVAGATLVGIPGVVVGHNRDIAWGVTNGMTDVQDLYIERFHHDDPTQVWYEGQWEAATVREEVIRVRGRRKPVIEPLLFTRHGPVLCGDWGAMGGDWLRKATHPTAKNANGQAGDQPHQGIALRWVAHQPGHTCRGMLRLDRAHDWASFTAALADWGDPAQNFVYADRSGNIGYYLAGRIPVRASGQGLLPVPGWEARHEWTGLIPFEELPHTYNPPSGFIVTANNRIVGPDYPYHLSNEWNNGYRARRITQFLQERPLISLDDCAALQNDVISLPARAVAHLTARRLRNAAGVRGAECGMRNGDGPPASNGEHSPVSTRSSHSALRTPHSTLDTVLDLLARWDGAMTVDSAAATISEYLLADLQARVFAVAIGDPTLRANYNGTSTQPVLPTTSYGVRSLPLLLHLLREADPAWLQTMAADPDAPVPTWDDLLWASLDAVCVRLRRKLGADPRRWTWGRVHSTRFIHALGRLPPLGRVFDVGPVPSNGSRDTVNSSAVTLEGRGLVASFGAAFRLIVDTGDWDGARVLIAPGQSGHPASPQYRPHLDAWQRGLYHMLPFSPAAVARMAVQTLTVVPEGESKKEELKSMK